MEADADLEDKEIMMSDFNNYTSSSSNDTILCLYLVLGYTIVRLVQNK